MVSLNFIPVLFLLPIQIYWLAKGQFPMSTEEVLILPKVVFVPGAVETLKECIFHYIFPLNYSV